MNGYLVPVADRAALAQRLIALLRRPGQARAFGRAGRALVEERFSVEAMVAGNLRVYRAVLAGRPLEPAGQKS